MSDKQIIAVVGATGAQGGGLARAILDDPDGGFALRAITRDVNGDKAKDLARRGAEVVAADVDNAESLEKAFAGAHGVFCVTFFWNHFSPAQEVAQATNMANAAKRAGARQVIWSTLEDTRKWVPLSDTRMPTLMGQYKVPHLDSKGEADHVFTDLGLPTTFLLTSFYWDNFIYFGAGPKPGPDGVLALTLPMGNSRLAGMAAEDIGRCAYGVFKRGQSLIGQRVGIVSEALTGAAIAGAMTKAFGREVRYNDVPPEVYRGFGFPGAEDLGNMYQFYRDFEAPFVAARDPELARALNPSLQTFAGWLAENAGRIPVS